MSVSRFNDLPKTQRFLGRYLIGTVVDDKDPMNRSRVKVLIPEVYNSDKENCPWFTVLRPVLRGNKDATGWVNVPREGSKVLVVFDSGEVESGIVIGEITLGSEKSGLQQKGDPSTWGFQDENQTKFEVNVEEGFLIIHHFGSFIKMMENGDVEVNVVKNLTGTVGENLSVSVGGDTIVDTSGSTTLKSGGSIDIEAGGSIKITASGDVTVKGSTIKLN